MDRNNHTNRESMTDIEKDGKERRTKRVDDRKKREKGR
jgi:hypothetical protein